MAKKDYLIPLLEWYRLESRKRQLEYQKAMDELDIQFRQKRRQLEREMENGN